MGLKVVTGGTVGYWGYGWLCVVTSGYVWLGVVTSVSGGYRAYEWLQVVKSGYMEVRVVAWGYK